MNIFKNKFIIFLQGDHIPRICNLISRNMLSWRTSADMPLLKWTDFVEKVKELDPLANSDFMKKAIGFLHETGKVSFKDEFKILRLHL